MGVIAGCYGSRDEKTIKRMLAALAPQGPKACGIHSNNNMVWGQCRPAGEDAGPQPLVNEDESKGLIASGDIYNSQTIRQRLASSYPFQTQSASEVILALYDQRGPDGVRDLDGMFAFALFDSDRDTFVLARDPIGIKPLYYGYRDGTIYFSSEQSALGLAAVDEIHEFPPGHYFTPDAGFVRYYRLPVVDKRPLVNAASIGLRIRKVLSRSVQKRLMSAPPLAVGALCRGDLSSFIVAALAARQTKDLHTFSLGRHEQSGPQSAVFQEGRQVAAHIGSHHHELTYRPEEYDEALHRVIKQLASYDPAVIGPAVPWYLASKLAADHVSVVLTGEGADELFAGYHYMQELPRAQVNEECRRCLGELHHLNLQRAARMTMSFNLEMRMPFLDKEMISLAMKIPADLKIKAQGSEAAISKWIFRQAFVDSDLLPREILSRTELQQAQARACPSVGAQLAEAAIDSEELARLRHDNPTAQIDSKEAALYFKILRQG